jgi:endoglucanase
MSRSAVIAAVLLAAAATVAAGVPGLASAAAAPAASTATPATAADHPAAPAAQRKPDAGIPFPLHTKGASIVDAHGHSLVLRMVNWYGAESSDFVVGGLAYAPLSEIISEIVADGFNGVRLPWSNQMWESNPVVSDTYLAANPQLKGEHARQIFETVVRDLANAGLMVVLDNHESDASVCCGNDADDLWYTSKYPQSSWIADWKSVVTEFRSIPQVIGVDLRNEPRGQAVWGGGNPAYDWHAAAQLGGDAVQSVDPNMLIFVEGTENATNLSGVPGLPVVLNVPDHVVYSAHTYGFFYKTQPDYDQYLADVKDWVYLAGTYPLWVGEFGTCDTSPSCVSSDDTSDLGEWFKVALRFFSYHNINWSYWALDGTTSNQDPNSWNTYGNVETYGVLNKAWDAPASTALLSALEAAEPRCGAAPLANGTYYIKNVNSGQVVDIPGFKTAQGTDLEQWPLNHGSNQRWTVSSLGCGLYTIKSVLDGESLDVSGQSLSNGARIDEYGYWGGGNQQFVITKDPSGSYIIASINSLNAVEVSGGSKTAGAEIDQWETHDGTNQEWTFAAA